MYVLKLLPGCCSASRLSLAPCPSHVSLYGLFNLTFPFVSSQMFFFFRRAYCGNRLRTGAPPQTPPLRGAFFPFSPPGEGQGGEEEEKIEGEERRGRRVGEKERRSREGEERRRREGEERRRREGEERKCFLTPPFFAALLWKSLTSTHTRCTLVQGGTNPLIVFPTFPLLPYLRLNIL